ALGITNFFFMKRYLSHVGSKPDFERLSVMRLLAILAGSFIVAVVIALIVYDVEVARYIVYAAAAMLLGVFAYFILKSGLGERKGFIATFILTLQGLVFFVFYQQMSTSLTLFALRNVQLDFFGLHIPPEQFQVLNPFWIFILSPFLALLYNKLGKHDKDFNIATKFAFGFVMLAVGFFIYGVSGHVGSAKLVSPWWMLSGYFFQSFGELLISGLGLAMVARFVAPRLRGFIMGGWLLTTGISQFFGSMVATVASVPDTIGKVLKLLPASEKTAFAQLPASLTHALSNFDLGAFRYWLAGHPVTSAALAKAPRLVQHKFKNFSESVQHTLQQLTPVADLPQATQHTLTRLNQDFYHTTLTLYTNLFLVLGLVAVGVALISFALVPYLKRLGAAHASGIKPESAVLPEHEAGDLPGDR
ncbi:MAG: oligopeptide:H+ symporter, partial [Gammaproteobacteria bacterium]